MANIFRGPFPNFLEGGGDSWGGDNPRLLLLLRLQSGVEHRIGPLYIYSLRHSFHHPAILGSLLTDYIHLRCHWNCHNRGWSRADSFWRTRT